MCDKVNPSVQTAPTAKMPEAWLTLSSSICLLQLISALMPLCKQSPRSPFVSVVLSTPSSRHLSAQLWGTTTHECACLFENSFLGRIRTYVYDVWCATTARALFHNPQPQPQQFPGPPLRPPCLPHQSGVWEITFTEPWLIRPVFLYADRGPGSTDTKHLSCNSSTSTRWNMSGRWREMICF